MAIKRFLLSVVSFVFLAFPAVAAELNTTFPGSDKIVEGKDYFGSYLVAFYQFFISAIAIMAVVVIMFAGFRWMTAQGNQERVSKAKETLTGAIVGVVLALMSWVILNFIDPNLIRLQLPNIESFAVPADVQPATVCPDAADTYDFGLADGSARHTYTPNCGETYVMNPTDINNILGSNSEKRFCHGWEADVEENACYFTQDTLTKLADKSAEAAHYIGTEISVLGNQQLDDMGWAGGLHGSQSSVDIDCDVLCNSRGDHECGEIWWDATFYKTNEYKMSKDCDTKGETYKRCVLLEPLKFVDDADGDTGTGKIEGAKCIE